MDVKVLTCFCLLQVNIHKTDVTLMTLVVNLALKGCPAVWALGMETKRPLATHGQTCMCDATEIEH